HVDRECQLVAPDETKATVSYARHALEGHDIDQHLQAGKLATRLAMTWRERLSFVIDDQVRIRKLQFLDSMRIAENRDELDGEAAEQADLTLMVGELREFLAELAKAIGSNDKDQP
ncbi:MAG TPA: recombination-associated protein RdgC, partial [Gammaproteobacteria bacterium]|nr:recombination-associated protein RdgC [Gammaproteobacteria bacterium]MCH78742.1 recombination-associated protein RdgC [Gammaproteobacteria bacterium]